MQCLCNANQTDILHIFILCLILRAYHLEILNPCRLDFNFECATDLNF